MSVYGHRCLGAKGRAEGCLGRMRFVGGGERGVYNQLLYWRGVWDVDGWSGAGGGSSGKEEGGEGGKEKVRAMAEFNRERFAVVGGVVEGYLGMCGRVWVQMEGIFGGMGGKV